MSAARYATKVDAELRRKTPRLVIVGRIQGGGREGRCNSCWSRSLWWSHYIRTPLLNAKNTVTRPEVKPIPGPRSWRWSNSGPVRWSWL